MSIQGVFNSEVTKDTSIWISAGFVQFTALIVCVIAWFVTGRESNVGGAFACQPQIYAAWWCNGSIYYLYRDTKCE